LGKKKIIHPTKFVFWTDRSLACVYIISSDFQPSLLLSIHLGVFVYSHHNSQQIPMCSPLIKWMIATDLTVTLSMLPLLLHHGGSNYWMHSSYVGNTEYIYNCILSRLVLQWGFLHYLLRDYKKEILLLNMLLSHY